MAEIGRIKWDASLGPEGAVVALCGIAKDASGLREGFRFKKQLIGVRRTADDAKRLVTSNWHFPSFLAGEIEYEDAMLHIFHVRDEDGVSNDKPITDRGVAFGDDVDPLVFRFLPKADFSDAAVRCVPVCDRQNL